MVGAELFTGPQSIRVRGERRALWICVVMAPASIGVAHLLFPGVSLAEFVLLIAAGLVFVSVARGRLLGSSIRIEGRQLPEVAELTASVAAELGMPIPQVFVRDDPFVPIAAVGVGEPYALIISSQYYEHLRREELRFLIARELGHIAAGHTRLTSLLSASGRENPLVAIVFGAWLRKTEFTADRVGLMCSSLDDALGAISITTFHAIGRRVDLDVLAEQKRELESEPALRLGEWIAGAPYATNRLEALRAFSTTPLAAHWRSRLEAQRALPPAPDVADVRHRVVREECASLARRLCAVLVDLALISALVQTPVLAHFSSDFSAHPDADSKTTQAVFDAIRTHIPEIRAGFQGSLVYLAFFLYSAILVGIGGQTLGMTVMDVRVVTTDFTRPGIAQSVWRYIVAFAMASSSLAIFGVFMRVQPHDRLSGTRLVGSRRAV